MPTPPASPPSPAAPLSAAATLWKVVKAAGSAWGADKCSRLGAALAYYTVFSIAPLLVIAIHVAGLVYGKEAAEGKIAGQVEHVVGEEGGKMIQTMVASAGKSGGGAVATAVGVVALVAGAAGLFGQLQDALNTIWGVRPTPGRGVWGMLKGRLLSFSMVLGVVFLLLVSLVVSSVLTVVAGTVGGGQTGVVGLLLTTAADLLVVTLLFALIFRYLPDVRMSWRDVWVGAAVTAGLFTAGKFLIGLYLGRAGVGSAYGAAGSLAVLLVWLYYSSQIVLFGAEVTKAYATHHGTALVPKPGAEAVPGVA